MLLKDILLNFLCFEDHLLLLNSEKKAHTVYFKGGEERMDCLIEKSWTYLPCLRKQLTTAGWESPDVEQIRIVNSHYN